MNAVENVVGGGSQFPFWDFGECNLATKWHITGFPLSSLNSLSGISVNVTAALLPTREPVAYLSLNSLSGISVNVTEVPALLKEILARGAVVSQFPFWDFFECN
jgi:hypothetical protein